MCIDLNSYILLCILTHFSWPSLPSSPPSNWLHSSYTSFKRTSFTVIKKYQFFCWDSEITYEETYSYVQHFATKSSFWATTETNQIYDRIFWNIQSNEIVFLIYKSMSSLELSMLKLYYSYLEILPKWPVAFWHIFSMSSLVKIYIIYWQSFHAEQYKKRTWL